MCRKTATFALKQPCLTLFAPEPTLRLAVDLSQSTVRPARLFPAHCIPERSIQHWLDLNSQTQAIPALCNQTQILTDVDERASQCCPRFSCGPKRWTAQLAPAHSNTSFLLNFLPGQEPSIWLPERMTARSHYTTGTPDQEGTHVLLVAQRCRHHSKEVNARARVARNPAAVGHQQYQQSVCLHHHGLTTAVWPTDLNDNVNRQPIH